MSDRRESTPRRRDVVDTDGTPGKCKGDHPGSPRPQETPSPIKHNKIGTLERGNHSYEKSTYHSCTETISSNSDSSDDNDVIRRIKHLSIKQIIDSPSGSTETLHLSMDNQNHNENSPNSTRDDASRSTNAATTDKSNINFNTALIDSFVFITKTLPEFDTWETDIISYEQGEPSHEGGHSYVYLFLDPRITNDLPNLTDQLDRIQIWDTFFKSIFYIGKGIENQTEKKQKKDDGANYCHHLIHFKTADKYSNAEPRPEVDEKTQKIIEIWNENKGVVCVQVFHNSSKNDVDIREKAMNDAIRLEKHTDWIHGKVQQKLGVHLLYRAMYVYLHDGERQVKKTEDKDNTPKSNKKKCKGGK